MIAFEVMEDSLTKFGNRNKMVFKWRYRNDIFVLTYNGTLWNYNSIQIQNCIVIKQYSLWQLYKLSYQTWGRGGVVAMIVRYLDLQLPVQSVPITTKVVSLNPADDEV